MKLGLEIYYPAKFPFATAVSDQLKARGRHDIIKKIGKAHFI